MGVNPPRQVIRVWSQAEVRGEMGRWEGILWLKWMERMTADPRVSRHRHPRVPKFRILKENGAQRVILTERRHKNKMGAWEYFADSGQAFDTCCFRAVGGEEKLQHFCAEHRLFLECIGRHVEDSV